MSDLSTGIITRILRQKTPFLGKVQFEQNEMCNEGLTQELGNIHEAKKTKRDILFQERKERDEKQRIRRKQLMRHEIHTQAYLRKLPHHLEDEEYESKLREVATLGLLKFFNAVAHEEANRSFSTKKKHRVAES